MRGKRAEGMSPFRFGKRMLLDEEGVGVTARSLLEVRGKTGNVAYTDVEATVERYRRDDLTSSRDGGGKQFGVGGTWLVLNARAVQPKVEVEEASEIAHHGACSSAVWVDHVPTVQQMPRAAETGLTWQRPSAA